MTAAIQAETAAIPLDTPSLLLDGGATATRARVYDADGGIVGEGQAGPGSLTLGVDGAWAAIQAATAQALAAAGMPARDLDGLPMAAALAGTGNLRQRAAFVQADPMGGRLRVMSDGHAWLIGALGGAPGIVAAVGTGVAVHRLTADGRCAMTSGWGFPAGDEGGGAAIGLQAVRRLLLTLDGRVRRPSPLTKLVAQSIGMEVATVQEWLRTADATAYAALAPLVAQAATRGDAAAETILSGAGRDIAKAIGALDRPVTAERLCLVGGMAPVLTDWLPDRLRERLTPPVGDAFDGMRLILAGRAPADAG